MLYQATADRLASTLQGYLEDNTGWQTAKESKGVIVEFKPSAEQGFQHGYLYRGQCVFHCPKETIFRYVDPVSGDDSLRVKWDKDVKSLETFRLLDGGDIRILRTYTNSAVMGLISPRDFVDIIYTIKTEDRISTNATSIEYSECPEDPKFVRGFNHPCGMVCMNADGQPNSTRMFTFVQPDIKGMLPKSLVDSAIPSSMVGFFGNLKAILVKDGHLSKK